MENSQLFGRNRVQPDEPKLCNLSGRDIRAARNSHGGTHVLGEYRTKTAGVFLCPVRGASIPASRFSLRLSLNPLRHRILAVSVAAALFLLSFLLTASRASADAGIVLNESLDTSVARITGSGHSAVYLSRICPDNSPTKMRLCRRSE